MPSVRSVPAVWAPTAARWDGRPLRDLDRYGGDGDARSSVRALNRPRARRSRRAQSPRPPLPRPNRACSVTLTLAFALIALVLVCAIIQRVAGMGLGIVFAPYAVVLIGAHEGIMLANFLGGLMPIVMLPRSWSQMEWDGVPWLGAPAVAVRRGAAWLSSLSPPGPLYLVVASLVLRSLLSSVLMARVDTTVDGRTAQVATGVGIGMGTVLGGVGGPAATVYAVLSRWPALPVGARLPPRWLLGSMVPCGAGGGGGGGRATGTP